MIALVASRAGRGHSWCGVLARAWLRGTTASVLVALVVAFAWNTAQAEEVQRDAGSGLEYLQVLTGGAGEGDPVPVVLALHGLGDHPSSFQIVLDDLSVKARIVLPRGPIPHGDDGFSWFNFRADDLESGGDMSEGITTSAERLATLLVALRTKHHGPPRAVVCGFSQGGMLSFALAAAHPELVAQAVPVAGYLPNSLWPASRPQYRPLPSLLALHGEADSVISLQSAQWSVEALRANGFSATLKSWPGVAHAISLAMRAALLAEVTRAVEELSPPAAVPDPAAAAGAMGPPAPAPAENTARPR